MAVANQISRNKAQSSGLLAALSCAACLTLGWPSPAAAQIFRDSGSAGAPQGRAATAGGGFARSTTVRRAGGADVGGVAGQTAAQERVPLGARPIIQDGDLNYPAEPTPQSDGVLDGLEPIVVQDGIDSTRYDTRPPEDYAPFESPPAGYDRDQFTIPAPNQQANTLNPTETRSGRQLLNDRADLFEDDPYQPLGINIGSFQFFPELEVAGQFKSNVLSAPDPNADQALEFLPSGRLVSNWSRHALEFRADGNLAWYNEFETENATGYLLGLRGRVDITSRSNVEASVARSLSQESRSAINASNLANTGDRIDILSDEVVVTGNHRFNRLRLRATVGFEDQDFGSSGEGVNLVTNDDRDIRSATQTLRASWEFKPTLSVFGEAGINQRDTKIALVADGIERDSNGQRYRIGLDFGNSGSYLRGSFSLGYGNQSPDSVLLEDVDGLLLDGDVEFRATELTSLLFTANSGISESTTAGSAGVISRTVGAGVRHAFRRNVIASAGFVASFRDYGGVNVQEQEYVTSLGVEYFMRRGVTLFADYDHTVFNSDFVDSDFIDDEVRVGMRLSR
ncbi:MAG: outer membrane beta-barrel protein [Hyphomicrobiaceae bacterium]